MDPARLSGELPLPADPPAGEPADEATHEFARINARKQGFRTACAGVITVAVVLLGLGLLAALFVSLANGMPGPRPLNLGAHLAGAVLAVPLYRWTRRGSWRGLAFLGLVVILGLLLWLFWWST